ncbi:unnamed protein product [Clonostachys byssicola]|uniref:Uncharacterized protein n=1 Tax=Clonostachys byssicola TaxID=160290 RepID=A0A9N9UAV6_9HYPO|nr:unnamed protein product [Clonostachys byssicola]
MEKRKCMSDDAQQAADQSKKRKQDEDTDEESDLEPLNEIDPDDITVAIFCALPYESVAVKYSLDQEFLCRPRASGQKKYVYSFGRIGEHKIVIARPHQMGPVKAAQCAATVCQQFPHVRFALIVGIGAGIPRLPDHDIRLGDIAVSIPKDGHPGVLEYDYGKYERDGAFSLKGCLDKPPPILISADGSLEEDEIMNRSPLRSILRTITRQCVFKRPSSDDILFHESFHHVSKGEGCARCLDVDDEKVLDRPERDKPRLPVVHRGLILSGGGVIKNPDDRNRLQRDQKDAICFEMEAAGIADEIPCLVVRGICDYADTHKQDEWHYYAAAVAAAYAKALLQKCDFSEVGGTRTMKETMQDVVKGLSTVTKSVNELAQLTDSNIQETKHKGLLDWLTPANYALQQSDFLRRRQPGTGQWLLDSSQYQHWLKSSKATLFCSGIPGAGKTILTSIVVDHLSNTFTKGSNVGVAYLYCNFRRQQEQTLEHYLASLLKQLTQEQDSISVSLQDLYGRHKHKHTQPSVAELSETLLDLMGAYEKVFIVMDALDECTTIGACRSKLLTELFNLREKTETRIFATSRVNDDISKAFHGALTIEIEASAKDLGAYLAGQMQLQQSDIFDTDLQNMTVSEIVRAANGMFLLAELHMNTVVGLPTKGDVKQALQNLAKGVEGLDETYQLAMRRIEDQGKGYRELAKQILAWIIHAKRPLSTQELRHALAVKPGMTTMDDDYIPTTRILRSVCTGLVTVDDESGTIRLVHYTTQQYFERTWTNWFPSAQIDITTICVTYLSFEVFQSGYCTTLRQFHRRLQSNPLYDYAAMNWGYHAREVSDLPKAVFDFLRCESRVEAASQVIMKAKSFLGSDINASPTGMTGHHLVAYFGVLKVLNELLGGCDLNIKDGYGRTPLSYAAEEGNEDVVELLIKKNVDLNVKDEEDCAPLLLAAKAGNHTIVEILLAEEGVEVNTRDINGQTPLSQAAENGSKLVVRTLLDKDGVDINLQDKYGQTPLLLAARNGHEAVVRLLIDKNSNPNAKDIDGWTPLSLAARNGHQVVVKTLLAKAGTNPDTKDKYGSTPLSLAAENQHEDVVDLLLANPNVDPNSKDDKGWTPLSLVVRNGYASIVKRFLAVRVTDPNARDPDSLTPLFLAVNNGDIEVVKLLLSRDGVNVNARDQYTQTPLLLASREGNEGLVKLLLAHEKIDPNLKNASGRTPLLLAIEKSHESVVKLLLDADGIDLEFADRNRWTALSWCAAHGLSEAVEKLLEKRSINPDLRDSCGQTPLSLAAGNGNVTIAKMLLETKQVDIDSKDIDGQTPLSLAAEYGYESMVKLLLAYDSKGLNLQDNRKRTPIIMAIENNHVAVVKQLLSHGGVNLNSSYYYGMGLRELALNRGYKGIVQMLDEVDASSSVELKPPVTFPISREPWDIAVEEDSLATAGIKCDSGSIYATGYSRSKLAQLTKAAKSSTVFS